MITVIRSFTELDQIHSFEERYEYLRVRGTVGREIFGFERHLNQSFYRSKQWRDVRNHVIARDNGCDLGIGGYEIHHRIIIHHMNPMVPEDLANGNPDIVNPEYLITTTHDTHNAIHFGDASQLKTTFPERRPGDTKLWSDLRRDYDLL